MLLDETGPENVKSMRELLDAVEAEGVAPEELWLLGEDLHYSVTVGCSDVGENCYCYDAVLQRNTDGLPGAFRIHNMHDEKPLLKLKPWHRLCQQSASILSSTSVNTATTWQAERMSARTYGAVGVFDVE